MGKLKKYLIGMMLVCLMIFCLNFSCFAAVENPNGDHTNDSIVIDPDTTDKLGGFGNVFEVEYRLYGSVIINNQVYKIDTVTYSASHRLTYAEALKYDPRDEIRTEGRLYSTSDSKLTTWLRLEEDTGISTTIWGGNQALLGPGGLHASVNIRLNISGGKTNSTLGSRVISDAIINLEEHYSSSGSVEDGDLTAALAGNSLVNNGTVFIGSTSMKTFARKHSRIDFSESLFNGMGGNIVQFYDQITESSAEYSLVATVTLIDGALLTQGQVPRYNAIAGTTFQGWYSEPNGAGGLTNKYIDAANLIVPGKTVTAPMKLYAYHTVNVARYSYANAEALQNKAYSLYGSVLVLPYGLPAILDDPTPPAANFTFGGWFTEKDGAGIQYDSIMPIYSDLTLYALWVTDPVTIEYYIKTSLSSGYSLYTTRTISRYTKLTPTYNISAPSIEGYNWQGWWFDTGLTEKASFTGSDAYLVTQDLTKLYAGYDATAAISADMHIIWNYESCDWTNDPYEIVSTLIIPETYRTSGHLYLHNCECHSHCDTHTHKYCSTCNLDVCKGHDGGLDCDKHTSHTSGCYIVSPLTGQKIQTCTKDLHEHTAWSSASNPGCHKTKYTLDSTYTSTACDGYQHSERTITCRFPYGSCSRTVTCRSCVHTFDCVDCGRLGINFLWYLNPTINATAICDSSIGTDTSGRYTIKYKIKSDSLPKDNAFKLTSKYEIIANETDPDYRTAPVHVDGYGQYWIISNDGRTQTREDTKGLYKFDGTNPDIEIEANYKNDENNTTTYDEGLWLNKDVTLKISVSDELSGLNEDSSYITITGRYLQAENNVVNVSERYSFGSDSFEGSFNVTKVGNGVLQLTLTKSGEYVIKVHAEDNADRGCTPAEDGIPNIREEEFDVNIDKIPPIIKYGYIDTPRPYVVYNGNKNRYETSSERTPSYYVHVSDQESDYPSSQLAAFISEVSDELVTGKQSSNLKNSGPIENDAFGVYRQVEISDKYLMQGKNTYLILYAVDRAGNETYNVLTIPTKEQFTIGNINATTGIIGANNSWTIKDLITREIPAAQIYINRSKLELTTEEPIKAIGGPLEITKVYDIKWDNNITFTNPADSKTFAVYRNEINDMIGLGYRVNFRYALIGYGQDAGDTTDLGFELYGKVQDKYQKLNMYLPDENGTLQLIPSTSEYYKRKFINPTMLNSFSEKQENDMAVNSAQWVKVDDDVVYLYFNYTIPANAKFKYNLLRDGNQITNDYTGTEILVKVNLYSRKYMDEQNYISYNLITDPYVPWTSQTITGSELLSQHFYGTSKTIKTLYQDGGEEQVTSNGQAFWYDAEMTALEDITGGRGQ